MNCVEITLMLAFANIMISVSLLMESNNSSKVWRATWNTKPRNASHISSNNAANTDKDATFYTKKRKTASKNHKNGNKCERTSTKSYLKTTTPADYSKY